MNAGDKPGDPEVEKSLSLAAVYAWLRDCPWQIERVIIAGGQDNRPLLDAGAALPTAGAEGD
jgi:hypothetical protein